MEAMGSFAVQWVQGQWSDEARALRTRSLAVGPSAGGRGHNMNKHLGGANVLQFMQKKLGTTEGL